MPPDRHCCGRTSSGSSAIQRSTSQSFQPWVSRRHLLATFSGHPLAPRTYRTMVASTIAIGLLGFAVWGHHMFVSGMNPYAGRGFGLATIAIAVPSAVEVIQWLAGIFAGGLRRATPLLFMLGFVSLFITGGLTGPVLAQPILDGYLHNTFFVVAHFHLVMGMAVSFALFAAIYYWFPLLTGKRMSERLGRWHFWLSLVGAYAVFLPMHFTGLAGEPRQYAQLTGTAGSCRICCLWSSSSPWRLSCWWRRSCSSCGICSIACARQRITR